MKLEDYPNEERLAKGLEKVLKKKVDANSLRVRAKIWESVKDLRITPGLRCTVKYKQPTETTWSVIVIAERDDWTEIQVQKEFDTSMDVGDVGEIDGYFHKLPIHAFKSAVMGVLDGALV